MSQLPHVRRHFLPWNRPLLPQVAEWLAGDWEGGGPLDLSGVLAIVPTRQSGRRLREALAEHAAKRGGAVFPPRVHTPDTLLAGAAAAPDVASRLEALLAWAEVLRTIELADVPEVFPVPPPRRDFAWAWQLAGTFFQLQTQLSEAGLGFAEVPSRAGSDFPEVGRWRQLGWLEQRQAKCLARLGKREPHAARRAFAAESAVPAGLLRVVVLAAPDPIPLLVPLLERWAAELPLDVVIHAPETEAGAFDGVGRPVPAHWERRVLTLEAFERRVHLCADPAAEAERAAAVAKGYVEPDGIVAFGIADPEVLPLLENELARARVASYNPLGRLRRHERLYALLAALAAVAREPTFDAAAALARCPDFLAALQLRFGAGFSVAHFLAALDELRMRHLPADLEAARQAAAGARDPRLAGGLAYLAEVHRTLATGAFPENAAAALQLLFGGRQFDLARDEDARLAEAAGEWRDVMWLCAAVREHFSALRTSEWWEVGLGLFGDARAPAEKPHGALELQGWLELLWEDAPHLVIAGLNDGLVPDAIVGDAFLPELLRERLGLKTNAARLARDAYLLQAIAASRTASTSPPSPPSFASSASFVSSPSSPPSSLDLLFAKTSTVGDPLRPSRLLLRCPDAELPARVSFLFRPAESLRPNLPWMRAWKLRPPGVSPLAPSGIEPPARVRVTGLRTWLACPFRFYLTHVLKMESVDPAKTELDARDFGTLCHAALEALARELRDCADEETLRELLLAELERGTRARFGAKLTLPLVVQLESARQRLSRFAAVQARERQAGWIIEQVEADFSLDIAGLAVRGKIDRIDRHEPTGRWRVLDYKTSDSATPPHKTHLRPFRAGDERLPPWMRVDVDGRECVWSDLQLPVYLRALGQLLPCGTAAGQPPHHDCGYITLPKAVGETGVSLWTGLTPELLAAAHVCTDGVAAAIRAGEFWPPAELPADRDMFAALFHHGAADSVEWSSTAGLATVLEIVPEEPRGVAERR
jgi:ATP-dependent helicase/nuclease subunit B